MATRASTQQDAFAPPCPKCRTPLVGIEVGEGEGVCGACSAPLGYVLFPALHRARPVARAVRSVDGDATCFFHTQNQAAAICDDCGRYLCEVCEVPAEDEGRLCPPCVSGRRKRTPQKAAEVITYDSIALTTALLPMLVWPLTLVTAPIALTLAIIGLRKPRSLVRRGTTGLVTAIVLGGLQIGGWAALGVYWWLS